jgi:hypothetical protein
LLRTGRTEYFWLPAKDNAGISAALREVQAGEFPVISYYKKTHPTLSLWNIWPHEPLIILKLVDFPSVLRYDSFVGIALVGF